MNENKTLRTTQFDRKNTYELGEIHFHIPTVYANTCQVFIVMKNVNKLYEIVELGKTAHSTNSQYIIYKLPINQEIRINNEEVELNILLINIESGMYEQSLPMNIKISTNNYTIARQVYIAKSVGQEIYSLYTKILGLTEENKKIYEKIKEGENYESCLR